MTSLIRTILICSVWGAAGLLAFTGCADRGPKLPPTVEVTGSVTINGQPLEKALIAFTPVESGPTSTGRVEKGKIVGLSSNGMKPGVVPGDHKVTIYDDVVEGESTDLVPNRYGRLDTALPATITEDGPNHLEFELKR